MAIFKINVNAAEEILPIVIGNNSITLEHSEQHIFTEENFTSETIPEYLHPNNVNPSKIKIFELNLIEGVLEYNSIPVTENQEIQIENINLLIYKSNENNTNSYSSDGFKFNIADEISNNYNENLEGGIKIEVLALKNQPPVIGNVEIETDYLQSIVLTKEMFLESIPPYSDPEGDLPLLLKIIELPTNGLLKLANSNVQELDIISFEDIKDGRLSFVPFSNNGEQFIDNFEFEIADSGSGQFVG